MFPEGLCKGIDGMQGYTCYFFTLIYIITHTIGYMFLNWLQFTTILG